MRPLDVTMRDLAQRNTWLLPSGELATRPGLREVWTPSVNESVVGAFTLRNPTTDDLWHYIVTHRDIAGAAKTTKLYVKDDNFETFQVLTLAQGPRPRMVTHASVLGEVLICSPDFPTVFGQVGGGVTFATSVPSDVRETDNIEVPRGLCVAWADRSVIALGANIFISDPRVFSGGSIRTFVGANAQSRPGVVYGLYVAAGGALVACTTDGVYAFPETAAAAGQVATGDWQQLSTHRTLDYGTTCLARGRLYGLTQRGIRQIDVEDGPEIPLNEPVAPRTYGARIARNDWRNGECIAGADGPIVSSKILGDPFHLMDIPRGFRAWWDLPTGSAVTPGAPVSTLLRADGEQLLACANGVYRTVGNMDGSETLASEGKLAFGYCIGTVPTSPHQSLTVREIHVGAEFNASEVLCSLRGDDGKGTDNRGMPVGPLVGTDSWGGGKYFRESELRSRRAQFKLETKDVAFEAGARGGEVRLSPTTHVLFDGIDEERPAGR